MIPAFRNALANKIATVIKSVFHRFVATGNTGPGVLDEVCCALSPVSSCPSSSGWLSPSVLLLPSGCNGIPSKVDMLYAATTNPRVAISSGTEVRHCQLFRCSSSLANNTLWQLECNRRVQHSWFGHGLGFMYRSRWRI